MRARPVRQLRPPVERFFRNAPEDRWPLTPLAHEDPGLLRREDERLARHFGLEDPGERGMRSALGLVPEAQL